MIRVIIVLALGAAGTVASAPFAAPVAVAGDCEDDVCKNGECKHKSGSNKNCDAEDGCDDTSCFTPQ